MRITIGRRGLAATGVALALAATAALAAGAAAHQRGSDGVRRILRQLELTGEQREAIRGVVQQHRESGQALRQRVADARRALNEAVTSGAADETRIRALAAELAPLTADAAVRRAGLYAGIRELLTDPQRAELDEMRDRRRQRRDRREWLQ